MVIRVSLLAALALSLLATATAQPPPSGSLREQYRQRIPLAAMDLSRGRVDHAQVPLQYQPWWQDDLRQSLAADGQVMNVTLDDPSADPNNISVSWKGMLEIEVTFGDYTGEILVEMNQVEAATGEKKEGLKQTLNTADFQGMHAVSIVLNFSAAYQAAGLYWYEFFLNREKKTQVPLTLKIES